MTVLADPATLSDAMDLRDPPDRRGVPGREERLLRSLERAAASSRFNLGERWLFVAGGAMVVGGFAVVLVGWVGASRTVLVAGQIPYLISGGLIGLGLVFVGAFLYFGHWLAVLVRESRERGVDEREDMALLRDSLGGVHRSLAALAVALQAGDPPAGAHPAAGQHRPAAGQHRPAADQHRPAADQDDLVATPTDLVATPTDLVATPTGSMAHRPGCRAVAGKPNVRPVGAADGLKLCGMCRPGGTGGWE